LLQETATIHLPPPLTVTRNGKRGTGGNVIPVERDVKVSGVPMSNLF
jgi:hypothetical protein